MEPTPLIISPLSRCSLGQAGGLGGGGLSSANHPTNNAVIYVPFRLLTPMPVKQVWWLQGGTASGNVDVGVYTLDMRLLLNSGVIAQSAFGASSIGVATFGTPTILYPGVYYMALGCSATTATFYHLPSLAAGVSGWKMLGLGQTNTAGLPLADNPTLATFVGGATPRVPYFGLCSESLF